jgi:hypothetical protein
VPRSGGGAKAGVFGGSGISSSSEQRSSASLPFVFGPDKRLLCREGTISNMVFANLAIFDGLGVCQIGLLQDRIECSLCLGRLEISLFVLLPRPGRLFGCRIPAWNLDRRPHSLSRQSRVLIGRSPKFLILRQRDRLLGCGRRFSIVADWFGPNRAMTFTVLSTRFVSWLPNIRTYLSLNFMP